MRSNRFIYDIGPVFNMGNGGGGSGPGTPQNLQQVLDTGNASTTGIILQSAPAANIMSANGAIVNSGTGDQTDYAANGVNVENNAGGEGQYSATGATITDAGGDVNIIEANAITMTDTAGNQNTIQADQYELGDGTNDLVINTGGLTYTAGDGSQTILFNDGQVRLIDSTGNQIDITPTEIIFTPLGSSKTLTLQYATQSAAHIQIFPNKAGTFAMTSDIPAASTLNNVLTAGNTSGLTMALITVSVSRVDLQPGVVSLEIISGNNPVLRMIGVSGQPVLQYTNGTGGIINDVFPTGTGGTITLTKPSATGTYALVSQIPVLVNGSFSVTGGVALTYTFAHGLGYNPSFVAFTPKTAGAQLAWYTWDGTNFTINFTVAPGAVTLTYSYQSTK